MGSWLSALFGLNNKRNTKNKHLETLQNNFYHKQTSNYLPEFTKYKHTLELNNEYGIPKIYNIATRYFTKFYKITGELNNSFYKKFTT
jgi:hypothetical protein